MKFFTTSQIAELDQYTIENEPIAAIDLMEHASEQFETWVETHYDISHRIAVFAGPGNNGGDALAVSRLLAEEKYIVDVFIPDSEKKTTETFRINLDRLKEILSVKTIQWNAEGVLPNLSNYDLIIDGLFGSGLTRPLSGFPAKLVKYLNYSGIPIISIDMPSGLMGEDNIGNDSEAIIRATCTLTFQFPKLSFFIRENEQFTGKWEVLPIGLNPKGIEQTETPWHYSDIKTMATILKPRGKFSHKGTYGHALLVAGSHGKMGAAILAAKGCLRSGVGLLSVQIPFEEIPIIQTAVPEAMVEIGYIFDNENSDRLRSKFRSIGIGPGIGINSATVNTLSALLKIDCVPLVIDADALNVLSENPKMIKLIPENSILTPHPLEFERLAGHAASDFERLNLAISFAQKHQVVLILKGAYTAIALPDGNCWFNTTGNPGMATGGSGDVLTGILTGLLAQGYTPTETALLGVYLHGLSGDISLSGSSEESLLASDIADNLGKAFTLLKNDPDFGKAKKKSQF
jgi:NAD(P)H-hydrate epimerase